VADYARLSRAGPRTCPQEQQILQGASTSPSVAQYLGNVRKANVELAWISWEVGDLKRCKLEVGGGSFCMGGMWV
jgi:hypothetical protein